MALLAALAQIQWPRPSTYIHYYTYMYIYKALIRLCVCVCWVLRMRPVFTVLLTAFLSSNCNELHELALERKKKLLPLPLLLLLHEIPFWPRICSQPKVLPVFHYFFSSSFPRRRLKEGSWPALVVENQSSLSLSNCACKCNCSNSNCNCNCSNIHVRWPKLIIYKNLFGPQQANTIEL